MGSQKVFGELLRKAIEEAEAMFDHPLKQYALFKAFEDEVMARKTPGVPDELAEQPHAQAYFGAMRLVLGEEAFAALNESTRKGMVTRSREMDKIVRDAVAENSLNPQNIEAAIRKGLLPLLCGARWISSMMAPPWR
jgi:type I restriction enzyme R subunit